MDPLLDKLEALWLELISLSRFSNPVQRLGELVRSVNVLGYAFLDDALKTLPPVDPSYESLADLRTHLMIFIGMKETCKDASEEDAKFWLDRHVPRMTKLTMKIMRELVITEAA